ADVNAVTTGFLAADANKPVRFRWTRKSPVAVGAVGGRNAVRFRVSEPNHRTLLRVASPLARFRMSSPSVSNAMMRTALVEGEPNPEIAWLRRPTSVAWFVDAVSYMIFVTVPVNGAAS